MSNQQNNNQESNWLSILYSGIEYLFETATLLMSVVLLIAFTVFLIADLFIYVANPITIPVLMLIGSITSIGLKKLNEWKASSQ